MATSIPETPVETSTGGSTTQKVEKSLCTVTKENDIRLLRLRLRGQGQLETTLETFTFSTAPPYEALSYVWGPKPRKEDEFKLAVQCEGHYHHLGLRPNLHLALMRIMSQPGGQDRTLWTDRICIDQTDGDDKAVQVAQMPKVYSSAQRVLVWLGDPARSLREPDLHASLDAKLLFDVADKVSDLATQAGPSFDPHNAPGLPLPNDPVWTVFSDLMRRDWYKRIWTLQEAVLAKELTFHYGTRTLTWDRIVRLATVYQQVSVLRDRDDEKEGRRWRFHHVRWAYQYREAMGQTPPKTIDFAHLLQTSMYKDSTEDEDRVYGVLGMAPEQIQAAIKPNYKKPLRRIYIDAFHQVLASDPSLQFLGLPFECGGGAAMADRWPTWCPDLRRWNGCEAQMQPPRLRRKHAEHPASIHIDGDDRLHVLGLAADTLAAVSPHRFPGDAVREPERRWRLIATYYRESLALARAAAATGAGADPDPHPDPEAAHWRTLIANRHGLPRTISSDDAERGYRSYFARGEQLRARPRTADEKRLANLYSTHVLAACNRRKFFRTRGGRVGLAPDTCQVGDVVCVFQGATVPHLLRRNIDDDEGTSSTFSFVGECYVHGLMDSVVVDDFDDGVVPGREFVVT